MMTRFLSVLTLVVLAQNAMAEPSSAVAWNPETLTLVKKGDVAKGQVIAQTCNSCHALGGEYPYIDGQIGPYVFKQLKDYKDKHRDNAVMTALATGLSDQDMADLSAYFQKQTAPTSKNPAKVSDKAIELVSRGDSRRILPPCAACHESNGLGQKIDVPALAGQNAAYLKQTLLDYKIGARKNDLYGRMRSIAKELSTEEIDALATYYQSLPH